MSEPATVTTEEGVERFLTEEEWQPAPSWAGERVATVRRVPKLVYSAPPEDSTASLDSPWAEPVWLTPTIEKISELLQLPPNWNSYRAAPVRSELAAALVTLLAQIMGDDTPPPSVVPTASGGLQAEWHRKGYDLEIEVCSPSRFVAYFEEIETGKTESRSVVSDLRPLVEWINAVTG